MKSVILFTFLFVILLISGLIIIRYRIRKIFFRKQLITAVQALYNKYEGNTFFSSFMLERIADVVSRFPTKIAERIIYLLSAQSWKSVYRILKRKTPDTAFIFWAHISPDDIYRRISQSAEIEYNDTLCLLIGAKIFAQKQQKEELQKYLELLKYKKLKPAEKALFLHLSALSDIYRGDFFPASQNLSTANKLFRKQQRWIEEAETWFDMGEMYRFCKYYDHAFMMYDGAQKLYQILQYQPGLGKIAYATGLLMFNQELYKEARSYFLQAARIFKKLKFKIRYADMLNQLVATDILLHQFAEAREKLKKVELICKEINHPAGKSLCQKLKKSLPSKKKHTLK